eukprot:330474-Pyramimonas_sp.AAC.2
MLNIAVVGNRCNEANHVPPSCTVHIDSRSVDGAEALGRLHLTKPPPLHWCLKRAHHGYVLGTRPR